ncbi:uncharacterized protein LOC104437001 isoform X2 [Eucalyptus grandis]|uniref:uncharacterized protein LOC104437001 isoform X2 n=1 Tax=Eucalyptus grandis TaxID=71139 RepID=UPI00192F0DB8|nr:uncharacterized protein LOC104437001 isoform X2 [Eucalyptus grandis]
MCCQSQESDIRGCTSLGRLLDLSCLKTLIILNINHCEEQDDIQSLEEASGGKVQKHIGEGEWSCCWTCGTLDSQNSSGSFKLIIRHEFDMLQGCKRSFWRQSTKSHRQGRAVMLLGLRPSGSPQCIGFFQANHQDARRGSLNIASITVRQSTGASLRFGAS